MGRVRAPRAGLVVGERRRLIVAHVSMIGVTIDHAASTSSARVNSDASPSSASRISVSYASGESTVNAEP